MYFKYDKPTIFKTITAFALFSLCMQLSGCAGDSYASKGAAQGAAQGAAAGAVGGLISALVFGGDPVDRAARGAVYGGTAGAVAGGMAGSRKDKQVKAQAQAQTAARQDAELAALKKEIGEDAFEGLASLAECQHDITISRAGKARQSDNPNYRLAGLWLEVLTYADLQKKRRLRKMLPVIVTEDWDIETEAQADQAIREATAELSIIRKDYNLPLVCSA